VSEWVSEWVNESCITMLSNVFSHFCSFSLIHSIRVRVFDFSKGLNNLRVDPSANELPLWQPLINTHSDWYSFLSLFLRRIVSVWWLTSFSHYLPLHLGYWPHDIILTFRTTSKHNPWTSLPSS
jgi:hypothetical protein